MSNNSYFALLEPYRVAILMSRNAQTSVKIYSIHNEEPVGRKH